MLAPPLCSSILRELADSPRQQAELRRVTGTLTPTTMRTQLSKLAAAGIVEKRRCNRFPGVIEYELAPAGRDLLFVAETLARWIEGGPTGGPLYGERAKAVVKALADSWSGEILGALAAGPMSLTELSGIVTSLSYPSIERRLSALRSTQLIAASDRTGAGRGVPYAISDWLRRGVAPLLVAARWERWHLRATTRPLDPLDTETALRLATPLVRIPKGLRGSCRLAIDRSNGSSGQPAKMVVEAADGIVARGNGTADAAAAWVVGSAFTWADALIGGDAGALELGGDCRLACGLLTGLHEALFKTKTAIPA